jgi:hypothetical protein
MQFEDLDKDTVCKYATSESIIAQMMFATHPAAIVGLLGELGHAKLLADEMSSNLLMADVAMIVGAMPKDEAHDDVVAAIRAACASVDLCFETILDAVMVYSNTFNHCNCPRCQQRRQARVAGSN